MFKSAAAFLACAECASAVAQPAATLAKIPATPDPVAAAQKNIDQFNQLKYGPARKSVDDAILAAQLALAKIAASKKAVLDAAAAVKVAELEWAAKDAAVKKLQAEMAPLNAENSKLTQDLLAAKTAAVKKGG